MSYPSIAAFLTAQGYGIWWLSDGPAIVGDLVAGGASTFTYQGAAYDTGLSRPDIGSLHAYNTPPVAANTPFWPNNYTYGAPTAPVVTERGRNWLSYNGLSNDTFFSATNAATRHWEAPAVVPGAFDPVGTDFSVVYVLLLSEVWGAFYNEIDPLNTLGTFCGDLWYSDAASYLAGAPQTGFSWFDEATVSENALRVFHSGSAALTLFTGPRSPLIQTEEASAAYTVAGLTLHTADPVNKTPEMVMLVWRSHGGSGGSASLYYQSETTTVTSVSTSKTYVGPSMTAPVTPVIGVGPCMGFDSSLHLPCVTGRIGVTAALRGYLSDSDAAALFPIIVSGTPGTTAPTTPTGLTWGGCTGPNAVLSWNAVTGSVPALIGYRLYRNGVMVYQGAALTFTDTGVVLGGMYDYTVSAYNATGESAQSAGIIVVPCAAGCQCVWTRTETCPGGMWVITENATCTPFVRAELPGACVWMRTEVPCD